MSKSKRAARLAAGAAVARVNHFLAQGFPVSSPVGNWKLKSAIRMAGDELGVERVTFRGRIGTPDKPGSYFRRYGLKPDWSIAAVRGELGTAPVLPGFVIKRTTRKTDAAGKVAAEYVTQTRAPGEAFAPLPGQRIKGESALLDGDGRTIAKWVKTDREPLSPAEMVEAIRSAFEAFASRALVLPPPAAVDDATATIYPLADLHLGLLTWRRETGVNWDLSIAQEVIRESVGRLVASAPPSRQAVVLGLGDLLHADGYDNATPKSKNVLDVDGRYPKILRAATLLMIEAVEAALARHERVLVRILRGNHDRESAIAVSLALSLHYRDHPRVTVDDDPGYFWWWRFGRNLLGGTHGDAAKMADLPMLMAARNPEAWGLTRFRAIFTGHIHTKTAVEVGGVTVESLRTPIPPDAWHHENGYGAGRALTAVTYHAERGEISRNTVNILPPENAA
ncbi:hypothetical protein [Methylobacterium gnaphalii]|uniref:Calcineurin-like phosphoesterase domain-containing protein n=1 Tax=Methylobacterium gnaphalii TaxID=1010610 RepID=A0A512JP87_9HYPH|nr:hypothetical protein [Methylobacterium gnaphalii]GEP11749.1 hypothetical protein MGN01_35940 [Methylobacterium gnaphalii]GJD69427.1 hypothetical protein MMMDOFMJ_2358 [Methylobacterium gnaphalii]GLS49616.1 hypothetical protein GCM10007885_24650 [Methylobacterium gnaphalii]